MIRRRKPFSIVYSSGRVAIRVPRPDGSTELVYLFGDPNDGTSLDLVESDEKPKDLAVCDGPLSGLDVPLEEQGVSLKQVGHQLVDLLYKTHRRLLGRRGRA